MMFNAGFSISASEPSSPAEVVARHFVFAAEAIPNSVAAVIHRNASAVQTSELIGPTSE